MRIHNVDTTGLSPTTYNEYYVVRSSGTRTNPINICGVPDALGNLPIITGVNAVGQASMSPGNGTVGLGVFSIYASPIGYWQSGAGGPNYIRFAGLNVQNANPNNTYTQPGGVAAACISGVPSGGSNTTCNWSSFTSAFNVRSGTDLVFTGIETNNVPLGVFSDDITSSDGFARYTENLMLDGNSFLNCGWTSTGSHCAYLQSLYATVQGNQMTGGGTYYTSGNGPIAVKFRGVEGVFRYNYIGTGFDRAFGLADVQGGGFYIDLTQYINGPWNGGNPLSGRDTAGMPVIAAYEESYRKDIEYGNIILWTDGGQVEYGDDTGNFSTSARDGTLYFYSNTVAQADEVFDNTFCSLGYLTCKYDIRNNIFWPKTGNNIKNYTLYIDWFMNAVTNLYSTGGAGGGGSISILNPLLGGYVPGSGTISTGWSANNNCSSGGANTPPPYPCTWPLTSPLQTHMIGLGTTNYIFTGTQPFNSGTFTIPSGSAAIGAATTLTGLPAQLPVRYQYNVSTSSLVARSLSDLTIGAQAYSGSSVSSNFSGGTFSGGKF